MYFSTVISSGLIWSPPLVSLRLFVFATHFLNALASFTSISIVPCFIELPRDVWRLHPLHANNFRLQLFSRWSFSLSLSSRIQPLPRFITAHFLFQFTALHSTLYISTFSVQSKIYKSGFSSNATCLICFSYSASLIQASMNTYI